MSRFERDHSQPVDAPADPKRDAPAATESVSEADDSAAHIAALVRRTTERQSTPRPAPVAEPNPTVAATPMPTRQFAPAPTATPAAAPTTAPTTAPAVAPTAAAAPTLTPPAVPQYAQQSVAPSRPSMLQPSRRNLVTAGVIAVLLIGGGLALTNSFGSKAAPPAAAGAVVGANAPAGYAVQVSDVITDCAGHSRGKTQSSFKAENCVKATRSLATGQVGGRPTLFVVSRIEMATGEAAASVKQVLDGNGTGNINDLLRDGKTYPGAPYEMPTSGYASLQNGKVVTVAEAGFVDDGRSSSTDPALRDAAAQVAGLAPAKG